MCGTTIAVLIVLIIVIASLIFGEAKDNFSNPADYGFMDVYDKIKNNWGSYPRRTLQKGTIIICKLAAFKTYRTIYQYKVVIIDNDTKDFDLIDYLRKTASADFNVNDPDAYSMAVTVAYIPSEENPYLAFYPIFYLEENYKGIPILGSSFINEPYEKNMFQIPKSIKSCRLNGHASIVVKKSTSDPGITLTADSPKLQL